MEKEQLVQKIKQGKLDYINGHWFIMTQLTSVNKIKHYDPEQMCDVYEEQVVTSWVHEVEVPYNCVNEEWFQIEAIQKNPANVQYFGSLASDAVWKKLLDMGGENLQYLKPQTLEMQTYAKTLSVENVGYFDSFTEQDVKELLMHKGVSIKALNGAWSVYKKNSSGGVGKELCWLRLEDCTDTEFFYNKAIEDDPYAAEAIVELAKNGETKPYWFVIQHADMQQFKNGIVELAKLKHQEALDVIFQNSGDDVYFRYIVNMARIDKNTKAQKIVYQNIDNEMCWNCVVGLAEDGDEYAHNLVLNHLDKPRSLKYVVNLALNGNNDMADYIYQNFNSKDCWHYVLKLANDGDERAVKMILKSKRLYPIMKLALKGNLDAIKLFLELKN